MCSRARPSIHFIQPFRSRRAADTFLPGDRGCAPRRGREGGGGAGGVWWSRRRRRCCRRRRRRCQRTEQGGNHDGTVQKKDGIVGGGDSAALCARAALLFVLILLLLLLLLFSIRIHQQHRSRRRRSIGGDAAAPQHFDVKLNTLAYAAPATAARWAVFYNIYISSNPLLAGVARSIVEEQLGQVGTSYAASAGDLTVYYTSIGAEIDAAWLGSLCSARYNMTCRRVAHYASGDEALSLAKLQEHCHLHHDQSVIYLHDKGSLHPRHKGQDRWRRTMTAAATSRLCLEPADDRCNACGMLFQPLPTNHFPGNMWTAKCTYINQLLTPAEYSARRPIVDAWMQTQTDLGIFARKSGLFPMERHYVGRERYESEHWLGSHPALQPCDVSQEPYKDYWLEEQRDITKQFQFAMAPRHGIEADWIWYQYTADNTTLTDPARRKRDYFLLRGIIYRWIVFYDQVPAAGSWIWTWFPDGEIWKIAVEEHGGLVAVNNVAQLPGAAAIAFPAPTVLRRVWRTVATARVDYLSGWTLGSKALRTTSVRGAQTGDHTRDLQR